MSRLVGKVVMVTGASQGLGEAAARALAADGARVVLAARGREAGEAVAAELRASGADARFIAHDVAEPDSWTQAMAAIDSVFGRLDGLVNNAGTADPGPLQTMELAAFRRAHQVNLHGVFLGTQAAIRAMRRGAAGGSIVNISSLAGRVGFPGAAAYCSSKGAVQALSFACAREERAAGIRVNVISPGVFLTPLARRAATPTPEIETAVTAAIPMRRLGDPAELGATVVFLISDESAGLTGADLPVDGGYTAQ